MFPQELITWRLEQQKLRVALAARLLLLFRSIYLSKEALVIMRCDKMSLKGESLEEIKKFLGLWDHIIAAREPHSENIATFVITFPMSYNPTINLALWTVFSAQWFVQLFPKHINLVEANGLHIRMFEKKD